MSIRPISAELARVAKEELNEDPARTPSDIATIKEWLQKQPHLSKIQTNDQWIAAFLRSSKFSLERCKQKLDMYYTLRAIVPEFFQNRDPSDKKIQEILKLGVTLPFQDIAGPDACRIYFMRLGVYDPSKHSMFDVLKVSFMITDILMQEDDNFIISGQHMLLDLKNVSFATISQFTPALAKKATMSSEKSYPIRQKGIHMINTPPGFEMAYNLFKSFLSQKQKDRIHVHNLDMESLMKFIPKNILPTDFGGTGLSLDELTDIWKKKVESYRDWFLADELNRSEEKKRPGKPRTTEDLFGIDGSFRQLNYD